MRSQQNTATALESLHVPVGAAAATTEPAPTRALRVRVVGATAIASAALATAVGLEALNVPLLLLFLTGLHGLVGRRGGAGADWSRLALAAGATFSAGVGFFAGLWGGGGVSAGGVPAP